MNRNLFIIIVVTALLMLACDPNQNGAPSAGVAKQDDATPAKQDVDAPAKAEAAGGGAAAAGAAGDAAPAPTETLSSCLDSCAGARTSPTDRATCRLNCESAYRRPLTAAAADDRGDPVSDAASCMVRCHATGGATVDTCKTGCKAIAAAAAVAPAGDVLDRLSTCIGTCHADKRGLPTNRATCELNCAQEAHVAGPAPSAAPLVAPR